MDQTIPFFSEYHGYLQSTLVVRLIPWIYETTPKPHVSGNSGRVEPETSSLFLKAFHALNQLMQHVVVIFPILEKEEERRGQLQ